MDEFHILPEQLAEMKKSLIRRKRHERKKKRTGLTGVNMYIDDIYDIVDIEDNKRR